MAKGGHNNWFGKALQSILLCLCIGTSVSLASSSGGFMVSLFVPYNIQPPRIETTTMESSFISKNAMVSWDISVTRDGVLVSENGTSVEAIFHYSNGSISTASIPYVLNSHLKYSTLATMNEGVVTVDLVGVFDSNWTSTNVKNALVYTYDFTVPSITATCITHTYLAQIPLVASFSKSVSSSIYVNNLIVGTINNVLSITQNILLQYGSNTINISVWDKAGNRASLIKTVLLDDFEYALAGTSTSDGLVKVLLTAGCVTENVGLTLNTSQTTLNTKDGSQLLSSLYDFKCTDKTGSIIPTISFINPVIIELPYLNLSQKALTIRYLDQTVSPSVWRADGITIISRDPVLQTIKAAVSHFTVFAVFGLNDYLNPVINWVKVNNTLLENEAYIPSIPHFELSAQDNASGDSGIMAISLALQDQAGVISSINLSLSNSANAIIDLNIPTASALVDGAYQLTAYVHDEAQHITTLNWALQVKSDTAISNFMIGPNPVNFKDSNLYFTFELSQPVNTQIKIFDVAGHLVKQLAMDSSALHSGHNLTSWDGRTESGEHVPAGLYLVYLVVDGGNGRSSSRVLLMVIK